ncbi:MAG: hypothetical protein ACREL2_07180 [Gemmatimonadales bacterium]
MDPRTAAIILAASLTAIAVALINGPIGKAVARRFDGGGRQVPSDAVGSGEFAARLGEVDELRARLAEVEERLDFQERLLAQGAPRGLPPERKDA